MKRKIKNIILKKKKIKIVCLTAYSKSIAKILDRYCDIILVGLYGKCFIWSQKYSQNKS